MALACLNVFTPFPSTGGWRVHHFQEWNLLNRWPKQHHYQKARGGDWVLLSLREEKQHLTGVHRKETHNHHHWERLRYPHLQLRTLHNRKLPHRNRRDCISGGVWAWGYDLHADWIPVFNQQHRAFRWIVCRNTIQWPQLPNILRNHPKRVRTINHERQTHSYNQIYNNSMYNVYTKYVLQVHLGWNGWVLHQPPANGPLRPASLPVHRNAWAGKN